MPLLSKQLAELGLLDTDAEKIASDVQRYSQTLSKEQCWERLTQEVLTAHYPFSVHQLLYKTIYPDSDKIPAPAWFPDQNASKTTNLAKMMKEKGFDNCQADYQAFHQWSVTNYPDFWQSMVTSLNIIFDTSYASLVDLSAGVESPKWFPGAQLNIVNSCFQATDKAIAIISQTEQGVTSKITYGELNKLSNQIANSLSKYLKRGDRVAIVMPMTSHAVTIYLGIIKAGCIVVGIPDSFVASEIATRLRIANVKAVFCQDQIIRDGKHLPLYERIVTASAPLTIVLPAEQSLSVTLRDHDLIWKDFLSDDDMFTPVSCAPNEYINILFSSGTTGEPKAIPWTHTAPIKCGSDAYLHHNIQPGDVFCWPTNLGWMMGPWLIFASLLNKATIALYDGTPNGKNFGKFVQDTKVTLLGVVPTFVKTWHTSGSMEGFDWSAIKLFTSTGERSNTEDMLYLMSLVNYRPIIEYCGGTEIAGSYVTGTVIQPCAPAACTTPALGLDFVIIGEIDKATDNGEVALIPPSIGFSTELLNKDHHEIYYAGMPTLHGKVLRRHGDQVEYYPNGFYRLLGRVDDTMKIAGIKISSAEIEATINALPAIYESAAIAVNPSDGGPSQLVIYVVLKQNENKDILSLKTDMQNLIKQKLNPLFKIYDVRLINALPRTPSNKVMRRVLRDEYQK